MSRWRDFHIKVKGTAFADADDKPLRISARAAQALTFRAVSSSSQQRDLAMHEIVTDPITSQARVLRWFRFLRAGGAALLVPPSNPIEITVDIPQGPLRQGRDYQIKVDIDFRDAWPILRAAIQALRQNARDPVIGVSNQANPGCPFLSLLVDDSTGPIRQVPLPLGVDAWRRAQRTVLRALDRTMEEPRSNQAAPAEDLGIHLEPFIDGLTPEVQVRRVPLQPGVVQETFSIRVSDGTAPGRHTGDVELYLADAQLVSQLLEVSVEIAPSVQPGREEYRWDMFVSYAHADERRVRDKMATVTHDPRCKPFIDTREFHGGEPHEDKVNEAIADSRLFYLFWSERAKKSPYVTKEWRYAIKEARRRPLPRSGCARRGGDGERNRYAEAAHV